MRNREDDQRLVAAAHGFSVDDEPEAGATDEQEAFLAALFAPKRGQAEAIAALHLDQNVTDSPKPDDQPEEAVAEPDTEVSEFIEAFNEMARGEE
jgi:hypothetical protein